MNKKHLIIPILALVLVIGWIVMIYIPASDEIQALDARFNELTAKQRNRISPLDVSILQTRVDSLTVRVRSRLASFYPEARLLDLGRSMERIGKTYNLKLVSIAPDMASLSLFSSQQAITELPVNVEFHGSFFNFAKFLDNMPSFPLAFKLNRMDVAKDEAAKGQLIIKLQGVLVINNDPATANDPKES